jgi:hypothetical protein
MREAPFNDLRMRQAFNLAPEPEEADRKPVF